MRACDRTRNKQGAEGYLLPVLDSCSDKIGVRLNDVVMIFMAVDIRHFLPEHPSVVGDDVVVIAGPLTGQLRKVIKIECGSQSECQVAKPCR